MRAPISRAGLLIFALAQSAGCVQTPSVLPTAGLAQRIAPLGPEAESAGRASGSASASPPEAAETRPNTPASGEREPSPLPGIAAGREPPLTLDEAKQLALRLNPQLAAARGGRGRAGERGGRVFGLSTDVRGQFRLPGVRLAGGGHR